MATSVTMPMIIVIPMIAEMLSGMCVSTGGEGLRVRDAGSGACNLEIRIVHHRQRGDFGEVQAVRGIEGVRGQLRQRHLSWIDDHVRNALRQGRAVTERLGVVDGAAGKIGGDKARHEGAPHASPRARGTGTSRDCGMLEVNVRSRNGP